jgi:hypothetical protein
MPQCGVAEEKEMKAFFFALIALAAITALAAFTLEHLTVSSSDEYSERTNVRLH